MIEFDIQRIFRTDNWAIRISKQTRCGPEFDLDGVCGILKHISPYKNFSILNYDPLEVHVLGSSVFSSDILIVNDKRLIEILEDAKTYNEHYG